MDALINIEPFEDFQNAVDEVVNNLQFTDSKSNRTISEAKSYLKELIKQNNFDVDATVDTLRNRGDGNKVNYLINTLKDKKKDILYKTLVKYNSLHGECVTNFDWTVKLALGTSALKELKYPFLELIICTTTTTGTQKEKMFNIKKDVLEKIIKSLESTIN